MDRFMTRGPGRQTRHSFSFGSSYDHERVSFGPLVALNDELLGSGAGYDAHDHADVVLVTWVVSGALAHEDATGRVVQQWLHPGEPGGEPGRRTTTPDLSSGNLTTVATEDHLGLPGAALSIAEVPAGSTVGVPQAPLRYLFVVTGALTRSSLAEPLSAGDAFEITGDHDVSVTAAVPTQLMAWSFARTRVC
jgi:hypothetical protein